MRYLCFYEFAMGADLSKRFIAYSPNLFSPRTREISGSFLCMYDKRSAPIMRNNVCVGLAWRRLTFEWKHCSGTSKYLINWRKLQPNNIFRRPDCVMVYFDLIADLMHFVNVNKHWEIDRCVQGAPVSIILTDSSSLFVIFDFCMINCLLILQFLKVRCKLSKKCC